MRVRRAMGAAVMMIDTSLTAAILRASNLLLQPASWCNGWSCDHAYTRALSHLLSSMSWAYWADPRQKMIKKNWKSKTWWRSAAARLAAYRAKIRRYCEITKRERIKGSMFPVCTICTIHWTHPECIGVSSLWPPSREAANVRKKAPGNCDLFGLRSKTGPGTIFLDLGVPFEVRLRMSTWITHMPVSKRDSRHWKTRIYMHAHEISQRHVL